MLANQTIMAKLLQSNAMSGEQSRLYECCTNIKKNPI